VPEKCPNNCDVEGLTRSKLPSHLAECPKRTEKCNCQRLIPVSQLYVRKHDGLWRLYWRFYREIVLEIL
jgi:hypothetical protein